MILVPGIAASARTPIEVESRCNRLEESIGIVFIEGSRRLVFRYTWYMPDYLHGLYCDSCQAKGFEKASCSPHVQQANPSKSRCLWLISTSVDAVVLSHHNHTVHQAHHLLEQRHRRPRIPSVVLRSYQYPRPTAQAFVSLLAKSYLSS